MPGVITFLASYFSSAATVIPAYMWWKSIEKRNFPPSFLPLIVLTKYIYRKIIRCYRGVTYKRKHDLLKYYLDSIVDSYLSDIRKYFLFLTVWNRLYMLLQL